jgi:hypothetical protein
MHYDFQIRKTCEIIFLNNYEYHQFNIHEM